MLTYPAGGLKFSLVFIYIHTLCVSSESSCEILKMRRLIGFVALAISEKSHVDQWTIPDTYICSTSAQKAELMVVEVLEVRQG